MRPAQRPCRASPWQLCSGWPGCQLAPEAAHRAAAAHATLPNQQSHLNSAYPAGQYLQHRLSSSYLLQSWLNPSPLWVFKEDGVYLKHGSLQGDPSRMGVSTCRPSHLQEERLPSCAEAVNATAGSCAWGGMAQATPTTVLEPCCTEHRAPQPALPSRAVRLVKRGLPQAMIEPAALPMAKCKHASPAARVLALERTAVSAVMQGMLGHLNDATCSYLLPGIEGTALLHII